MNKNKIEFPMYSSEMFQVLKEGRVLLVGEGKEGKPNPMTIAWGSIMYSWHRPVFVAMVRDSRHTYGLLEESDSFTVNFFTKDYSKELGFCGSKSGRDYDKWKENNLTPIKAKSVSTSIIEEAFLNIECKVVFTNEMDPKDLDKALLEKYYQKDGQTLAYHKFYYGEIVDMYGDTSKFE